MTSRSDVPRPYTRRQLLRHSLMTAGGLALGAGVPRAVFAQMENATPANPAAGDRYDTDNGILSVHPVQHASFVLQTPGGVIHNDPVGGALLYAALPRPDLILLTHEHGDHYDVATLEALMGENTVLIANPAVHDQLPGALKERSTAIGNGDSTEALGMSIEAVAAYNLTEERLKYHPKGRDNGYVLNVDGKRVYTAADTEAVPEMRELENIDIAFVPMNLPYTMGVEQAAEGVLDFAPKVIYPYHYGKSDIDAFEALVVEGNADIDIVRGRWYG